LQLGSDLPDCALLNVALYCKSLNCRQSQCAAIDKTPIDGIM